ncbi:Hydrogenase maturation factor HypA [Candidatus Magnetomoraceae bacterium gMMP-15]
MHEMSIALQVLDIAISSIPNSMKDSQVEAVNLKVGKLTAIVPESLKFCFDIIAKDTPLNGAELRIKEMPLIVKCLDCNLKSELKTPIFSCKNCNSSNIEIISGQELDIISIELPDNNPKL